MAFCTNCGTEIKEGYEFCPECGISLSERNEKQSEYATKDIMKKCRHCGEQMPEDSFYCLSCGNPFDDQQQDFEVLKSRVNNIGKPPKRAIDTSVGIWRNKWVALILCIFFGAFGIHRFYEGKKITGFIYLFSFGLFGLGWFFDIILLATKPNPYRVK